MIDDEAEEGEEEEQDEEEAVAEEIGVDNDGNLADFIVPDEDDVTRHVQRCVR